MAKKIKNSNQPRRHIKNYLLDKRFQLLWAARIILAMVLVASVMGYLLYNTVSNATDQLVVSKIGDASLTEEAVEAFIAQGEKDKIFTVVTLVTGLVIIVLLLGTGAIVLTHKIAGPIFKMRKIFTSINGNNLVLFAKLRKGDELQDAFKDFESMMKRIREHKHQDLKELIKIKDKASKLDDSHEIVSRLNEMIVNYKNSVKS